MFVTFVTELVTTPQIPPRDKNSGSSPSVANACVETAPGPAAPCVSAKAVFPEESSAAERRKTDASWSFCA